MIVEIHGTNSVYHVDTELVTCDCPDFKFRRRTYNINDPNRLCKHLSQVVTSLNTGTLKKTYHHRTVIEYYINVVEDLIKEFESLIIKREYCGSYRRGKEFSGDIDLLFTTDDPELTSKIFNKLLNEKRFTKLVMGNVKASYVIDNLIQVDVRFIQKDRWAFALLHATGSKMENIRLRRKSKSLGYSLSEYGFDGQPKGLLTEEDIYKFLGEPYKEPKDRI